ncbi:unnamed protein product [Bursaphelenchus xylophilus]|uniref:(pine wood nematode) hypothetical protein n=1 Tax=Bursaphelenchus xylophilus TaxID=6326 RepID=A0A1I7S905_BURXY|nr:unnamed protein product [Bursaphelenchus xylophilus]CAG9086096.1 unnamed protein product [Bursaphelenchus xylophilus]
MGLQGFVNKKIENRMENKAKKAIDGVVGGSDSGGHEDEEDERGEEGRGRKLLRKLSKKVRRSQSESPESAENRKAKKGAKKKKKQKGEGVLADDGGGSGPDIQVGTSGTDTGGSVKPSESGTETPIESADTGSSGTSSAGSGDERNSRDGSDWQTNSTATDQSDVEDQKRKSTKKEEKRLREMRPDGATAFNPKAHTEFTVRVRVIEAKELQGEGLNPLVRVNLGSKTRTTRSIRGTDRPFWNQTLGFTIKSCIEDLAMLNCEFNVYSARRLIRDSLIGSFGINMGVVYQSKNQSVVEKWVALMPSRQEDDNGIGAATEIRGFLKISICVFHPNQIPPSLVVRGGGDDDTDVLFRAQLLNYCLRIRIYKITQLADHIRYPYKKDPSEAGQIAVEVAVGAYNCLSTFQSASDETISFGEELQIPIMWPTVIKQLRFRLIALNRRRRKRVLCTEFVNMRDLCQPGERGFLPNFGPAYIPFFGPEPNRKTWKPWEKNHVRDGKVMGSHYCGRVFFELSCEESGVQKTHVISIPTAIVQNAENFYRQDRFTLFCSFFAANLIHSDFKSKNVKFLVSIGEFGSQDYGNVLTCTNQTLPVMPSYDTSCLYTMPWGNHKPICEILCDWEDISWRFEISNILYKTADLLFEVQEEAQMKSGSNPEQSELASLVIEAIEEAADCFDVLNRIIRNVQQSNASLTALDILLLNARADALYRYYKTFADFKFNLIDVSDMEENTIRQLGVFANQLKEIANDPQLSVPDLCVHMIVDNAVVGYARVPVHEIYYSKSSLRCGRYSGKIQAVPLSWPTAQLTKFRGHELPGVIHIKAWFGKTKYRKSWLELIRPGFMKYYAELFINEHRSAFSSKWKPTEKPFNISDETGKIELSETAIHPPSGWDFEGKWTLKRCHDMWVGADAGHTSFEDEFFEVQQKNTITQEWKFHMSTGFYGDPLDKHSLHEAPPGWVYVTQWNIDYHSLGDAEGWVYSSGLMFWDEQNVDTVERLSHRYRRRRHVRRRIFGKKDIGVAEMFEDLREFAKNLDEDGWEFAAKFGEPVHLLLQCGDKFRRRRMVRELVPQKEDFHYKLEMGVEGSKEVADDPHFLSPRIYEVHDQVSVFQLRVYVLWAREVHSPKKHLSRAFVKVFFLNRCQQTYVVENSLNPIWNETLIFNKILIPGGSATLQMNPPGAVVEVHGEEENGKPVFLGRFDLKPVVVNSTTDPRSRPGWRPLRFPNNKIKGALLLHMELFLNDPAFQSMVPIVPAYKPKLENRFEVPIDCRPVFTNFTVQIMAWGVRNLARHQLLSVRSPFVEITVADRKDTTDIIEDTSVNPNFVMPLLTFSEVQMPAELGFAPPIVLNLHDRRSFGRQPLVGACIVKNFQKYMISPPPVHTPLAMAWESFDQEMSHEYKKQMEEIRTLRKLEPEEYLAYPEDPNSPKIDWWSRYYFSKNVIEKAPGYKELNLGRLAIYKVPLEDVGEYKGFEDFLDTFVFTKPYANKLDSICDKKGELKGKLFITKHDGKSDVQSTPSGVEFDGPVECVIRVYIVSAYDLVSRRRSGLCDPYINIRCGNKKKFKGYKDYRPETLDPVFGQCVEMEVTIPQEKDLTISVMDKRLFMSDNEIGSTTIDLENRLLTKFRATVGMPKEYNVVGPLPWKDQLTPLQIMRRYCQKMNLPPPKILHTDKGDAIEWADCTFYVSDLEKDKMNENFSGRPIQCLALNILHKLGLVPEHIETRPLYHSVNPEMECGQLEMFVHIFPKVISDRIPSPIDISPRQPQPYQLRVVIWGLRNVILPKKSFGRPAADLYVRCYLNGMEKSQKTDIHFRCLDGAASFNWRFVFDFDYDVFQRQIQVYKKKRWFRKKSSELVDPFLIIQIWDNNKFKKDRYIGQVQLDLLGFEEGLLDEEEIEAVGYEKDSNKGCTCCKVCTMGCKLCWKTRCCSRRPSRKKEAVKMPRAPRYIPGAMGDMSLFQQRSASGFWPAIATNLPTKQRAENEEREKKHDVSKPDEQGDNQVDSVEYVTGLVEMEMTLLPLEEALSHPVGRKRNKPNHSPFLPKPDRPKLDSFWCTSRAKAICRICWHKTGGWSCVWMVVCALLLTLLIVATVYQLPTITATFFTTWIVG